MITMIAGVVLTHVAGFCLGLLVSLIFIEKKLRGGGK